MASMLSRLSNGVQRPQGRRTVRLLITALILMVFAFLVWQRVDLALVGAVFRDADSMLVILAIIPLNGLAILAATAKWQYLLRLYGIRCPFWYVLRLYVIGMFAGFLLSDSLGAFIKAFYLKKDGHPLSTSVVTIVLDKLTELLVFFGTGLVALYTAPLLVFENTQPLVAAAILTVFLAVWLVVRFWQPILRALQRLLGKYLTKSLRRFSQVPMEDFSGPYSIRAADWAWVLAWSLASQILQYMALYLLMLSIGLVLPVGLALAIIVTVGFISMLPVSLGGIGTRDAALIFWFQAIGESAERALALSVLMLLLYLVWRLVGFFAYLLTPRAAVGGSMFSPEQRS